MSVVIKVENLGKRYVISHQEQQRYRTLRDVVTNKFKSFGKKTASTKEEIWALKNVSFEVKQGERVGIIGRNGAGKSTLLKLLSRITEPTKGKIGLCGRVGSLLEVGTGFHPELTGRENIYLNGAILGMSKSDIRKKFDDIVAFAEIDKFLDTPVKRYSSGMYVRLAFAVAAHLEPEILLVDEVLAVGDVSFQKKCLGKMEDVARQGMTVIFVSHNMGAIENLCQRTILIDAGAVKRDDDTSTTIALYLENISTNISTVSLLERKDRSGSGIVKFSDFRIEDLLGNSLNVVHSGQDIVFIFDFASTNSANSLNVDVGFGVFSPMGQLLFVLYSSYTGEEFKELAIQGSFCCRVNKLPLIPGRYRVGARIVVGQDESDWPADGIGYFDVEAGDFYGTGSMGFGQCPILVDGSWFLK
ncbi:MAG: ABC transporter ATP-binding protein [Candidatus Omnitrophota bacterium]